jgi:hypothetical protein
MADFTTDQQRQLLGQPIAPEHLLDAVHQAWQAEGQPAGSCWDLIDHSDLIEAEQELPLRWAI